MRNVLKMILVLITVAIFFTACNNGNNPAQPTQVPVVVNTDDPNNSVPSPQISINPESFAKDMDALISTKRPLSIKKKGLNMYYEASDLLTVAVTDIIIKMRPLSPDYPEDLKLISDHNKTNYDYILQYGGVVDILFSLEDNIVLFEDQNQLYQMWGETKEFWDSLVFDDTNVTIDLPEGTTEYKVISYLYKEDINGDGTEEDISITYKRNYNEEFMGNLYLQIKDSEALVYKNMLWQNYPINSLNNPPELLFLPQSNSKEKIIVSTISWATTSLGNTTTVLAYVYLNGELQKVGFNSPEMQFSYDQGENYKAIFSHMNEPLNEPLNVRFDLTTYLNYISKEKTFKEVLESKETFTNHPLAFSIKDYDGDGILEICSMSSLLFEDPMKLSIGVLQTIYEASSNKLVPTKVFISPPYYKEVKRSQIVNHLYTAIFYYGSLSLEDKEAEKKWRKDTEEFSADEIQPVLDELLNEKILKVKDKKVYVNY